MASAQSSVDKASANLDLGVSVILYNWSALTIAVQNQWGGPKSAEKREWLCGEIPEILRTRPETDDIDMEEILLNVMMDEFDVAVEDDSGVAVAEEIIKVRDWCARGEFDKVKAMWEEYEKKQKKSSQVKVTQQKTENDDDDDDDDNDDNNNENGEDDDEGAKDIEMTDAAPAARSPRQKIEPEVDEDGFTTVVNRKRR
ncbi:hypothetical protein KEM54_005086 [Ascosphaera aggregata]|nr:hypothetical protein KEM54_005086 [Ascosphaera aggregata]